MERHRDHCRDGKIDEIQVGSIEQVTLTAEGRSLAGKVDKGARQLVQESEAPLRADQVDKLHEHLRSVRKALLPNARPGN